MLQKKENVKKITPEGRLIAYIQTIKLTSRCTWCRLTLAKVSQAGTSRFWTKKVAPRCVNLSVSEADCLLDVWLFFNIRSFTQAELLCNILCIAVPGSECSGLNATLAGKLMCPFSALFYFN